MEPKVLFREIESVSDKKVGIATLNSPRSLNALNLEMVNLLLDKLTLWKNDPNIAVVLINSVSDKAFCAGGDIRAMHTSINNDDLPSLEAFFTIEYQLDYLIHTFEKPIIVWGKGLVIGGGLGLLVGASHRIVSDISSLSMPEISVGLYPDVGATYFLNKMPRGAGMFFGLTGVAVNALDAKYLNLADYYLTEKQYQDLFDELLLVKWGSTTALNHQKLTDMLIKLEKNSIHLAPQSQFKPHLQLIEKLTVASSVESNVAAIMGEVSEDDWFKGAQQKLMKGSPLTAHIVAKQINECSHLSLADALRLELSLSMKVAQMHDFSEGVRALIIDKDKNPKWQFETVHDIDSNVVDELFTPMWDCENNPLKTLGKY